jgi:hypothetical protein
LAGVLWKAEWRVVPSGLASAFAAFFGILLISVVPAAIYSGAVAGVGSLVRVALFGISIYVFFYGAYGPGREVNARRSVQLLYAAAAMAALFACVDFYYQFPAPAGYGPQFVWLDSGVYRRAQGLFYEASTLGNFCAFFLVMIAVAFTRSSAEVPVSRKWLLAGGAVFFTALVLSYSRGSLINVAVSLAVLLWMNRRRVPLVRGAMVAAVGALAIWWIFPAFAQAYWTRLSASTEFLFTSTNGVLSGPPDQLGNTGGLDRRQPVAGLLRNRLQDLAVHAISGQPRGSRQHVPQLAGGDRSSRTGGAHLAECGDFAGGGGVGASLLFWNVDAVFLGGRGSADGLGRSAHILARSAGIFLDSGSGGAAVNVLLLDQYSDLGGAQQVLLELLPAIRERGWRAVVGLPGSGKLRDAIRGLGIEVERIDCASDARRYLAQTPRLTAQVRDLAERTGADLAYLNGPRVVPAAALAGLKCPVMFHSHSWLPPGLARTAAGVALRRMDARVVANCEFVASQWRRFCQDGVDFGGAQRRGGPGGRCADRIGRCESGALGASVRKKDKGNL